MNGCKHCFSEASPVELVTTDPKIGTCDFCDLHGQEVWTTTEWTEHFLRVMDLYEIDGTTSSGLPLHLRLQDDWQIFSTRRDPDVNKRFMMSMFPDGHDLLSASKVRAVQSENADDHIHDWDLFARQLVNDNRFFPALQIKKDYLEQVVRDNVRTIAGGASLFRARVGTSPSPLPPEVMGKPPAHLATPGRANSLGIPHFYAAFDRDTSIIESRALQHNYVSVAVFKTTKDIECLNLATLKSENPFKIEQGGIERLASWKYLRRLGTELSKPIRGTDNKIDYVPTQYLCDFVKSLGITGIRYGSSLNPRGENLVLFTDEYIEIKPPVKAVEVTGATYEFTDL